MTQATQDIWKRFDAAIEKAETPEAKALVEAIKLQTELLNMQFGQLTHHLANIGRQIANPPAKGSF